MILLSKYLSNANEKRKSENTAIKTDGTMWTWGKSTQGALGQNNETSYSSPKQIPGTSWSTKKHHSGANNRGFAVIQEL